MIKSISVALLASAGVALAGGGDFYEAPGNPSFTPTGSSFGGGSNFFIGGSVEYLIDFEEALYTGHIGYDFGNSSIYVEGGYSSSDEGGVEIDLVPVTVNYKFETPIADRLSFYIGGGVGVAFVEAEGFGSSVDDEVVALQAFTGLVYNLSDTFEIYGGARYLWTDDVEFGGVDVDGVNDVSFGGGIRINF